MKCNRPIEAPVCSFHFNGVCSREHNYECPALAKPRYIDANKLVDLAMHEGAYGYVDVHDIRNTPTADVVAVVRCRNCCYSEYDEAHDWYVCYGSFCTIHDGNFYCAAGERREEKTNAKVH